MQQTAHAPRGAAIAATSAALLVLVVYLLRLDRVAGLIVDDAWYVLLAQALAQGRGFRLVSSAAAQILPIVPPGFPAVLAVIFRISPSFPANVIALKAVLVASMLGAGAVTGYYFARCRHESWPFALALATATTLVPAFVFLATSTVMAECVFMLGQMAAIVLVERSVAASDDAWGWKTCAAALAAAARDAPASDRHRAGRSCRPVSAVQAALAACDCLCSRRTGLHAAVDGVFASQCANGGPAP